MALDINDPRLLMLLARLGEDKATDMETAYSHVPNAPDHQRTLQDAADIRSLVKDLTAAHETAK